MPTPVTHELTMVSWMTEHTVSWVTAPGGLGQVPVREPLPTPHARWYCSCGDVSGRISVHGNKVKSQAVAEQAHKRHAEHYS